MKTPFLVDIAKTLKTDEKAGDKSSYAVVQEKLMDGNKCIGYKVSLGGETDVVEARKFAGAEVGDTVMVMRMSNGSVVVTGRKDGDKDASDAQATADNAKETADNAQETANEAIDMAEDAEETAEEAKSAVDIVKSHFWTDDNGAHVTQAPNSTTGGNTLINSNGMVIANGDPTNTSNQLASFGVSGGEPSIVLGKLNSQNVHIDSDSMDVRNGNQILTSFGKSSVTDWSGRTRDINGIISNDDFAIVNNTWSMVMQTGALYFGLGGSGRYNTPIFGLTDKLEAFVNLLLRNSTYSVDLKCSSTGNRLVVPQLPSSTKTNAANVYVNSDGAFYLHSSSNSMAESVANETVDTDKLLNISVSKYKPKSDDENANSESNYKVGIFVEDIYEVYPEICSLDGKNEPIDWDAQGMIAIMLEKMKSQQREIDELKQRISALEV